MVCWKSKVMDKVIHDKDGILIRSTDRGVELVSEDAKYLVQRSHAIEVLEILSLNNNSALPSVKEYLDHRKIDEYLNARKQDPDNINESILGRALGALTGATLGTKVGKVLCKVLGIEQGPLYNLMTSNIVGASIGQEIMKNVI